jgi:nicotinate-nucleotide pyrophosphorylase (carboxylating)
MMTSYIKIKEFMQSALLEDIGRGDLFSSLGSKEIHSANIIAKDSGILAGVEYVKVLTSICDVDVEFFKHDSDEFVVGDIIATLKAPATTLLEIERTFLNTLQHASGIATNAKKTLDLLVGTNIKLLDTRKTRPNLREFEKYATKVAGAYNHRMGLDDCLMLKDTHLKSIDNLEEFMIKARKSIPWTSKIEIECESIDMAKEAMSVGADIIMCDNMNLQDIKSVIEYRCENFPHVLIEVSGNIDKDNIQQYKELGIDAISSGSLIHQAKWIDLSMKFQ